MEENLDSICPRAGEAVVETVEEVEEEVVVTSEADAEAAVEVDSEEEAETAEVEEASEELHVEAEAHQDSREPELCCEHDRMKGKVYIVEIESTSFCWWPNNGVAAM